MIGSDLYTSRIPRLVESIRRLGLWDANPRFGQKTPESCDFMLGNPQDMPLPGFVAAIQKWSQPQSPDWFAYFSGTAHAGEVVARSLSRTLGRPYEPADIVMTNGAFGALAVALNMLAGPGDEVIFNLPPWFFYEGLIIQAGATPVPVNVNMETYDLDLGAIAAAITPRTRAIIVNSPNNPTGKLYPPATLQGLADLLARASEEHGRPIYLISDEAYRRVVFDGREYPSPTAYYPHSLMVYTYGKTLLTPGERLGYLAISPEMPQREALREPMLAAQIFTGYATAGSVLMHGLADIELLSIDIAPLERRRDRLVEALTSFGYSIRAPEGSFYLFPRSPLADDVRFCEILADNDIFCLPGSVFHVPGHFRISITASDAMVERSIPRFAAAMEQAA